MWALLNSRDSRLGKLSVLPRRNSPHIFPSPSLPIPALHAFPGLAMPKIGKARKIPSIGIMKTVRAALAGLAALGGGTSWQDENWRAR